MSDPTLVKTSVKISYTASDKYRHSFEARGGKGVPNRVTGVEVHPHKAYLSAVEELARLSELFGFGAEAKTKFEKGQQAVKDWRELNAGLKAATEQGGQQ